jgi:hypothetical protein
LGTIFANEPKLLKAVLRNLTSAEDKFPGTKPLGPASSFPFQKGEEIPVIKKRDDLANLIILDVCPDPVDKLNAYIGGAFARENVHLDFNAAVFLQNLRPMLGSLGPVAIEEGIAEKDDARCSEIHGSKRHWEFGVVAVA